VYQIDPDRLDLLEEFKARPFGEHSPDLQYMLNQLRRDTGDEFPVLVMTKPYEQWTLAWMKTGVIAPPRRTNTTFDSIEQAEWEVFKIRFKAATGRDCPVA